MILNNQGTYDSASEDEDEPMIEHDNELNNDNELELEFEDG